MLLRKAYRFRIYPDAAQKELFRRTIGCCRLVYNLCLDQKMLERERSNPRKLSAFDQMKELTALKDEFSFLKEPPNHPLQQAIHDLHKAFANFFEGRARFPRFRRKGENDSFRYPDPKQIKVGTDRIFLPKAGWTRMVLHRPIAGKIRNVTITLTAGDWHASIQVEQEIGEVPVNRGPFIGIDLGSAQPIVLSNGTVIGLPRTTATDRRRLGNAQRVVARRRKGSRNREKAKRRVARLQAAYARRRRDAAHKATTTIVKNHGIVVIEDLQIKEMTETGRGTVDKPGTLVRKRANENRALLEVSPRTIRSMLEYKSLWYGATLVVVDPAETSQECHACGVLDAASRISRSKFVCTSCGVISDADVNAARNILRRGLEPTGGLPGMACGSSRNSGRKQEEGAREGRSSVLQGRE
jgi:putative transposase